MNRSTEKERMTSRHAQEDVILADVKRQQVKSAWRLELYENTMFREKKDARKMKSKWLLNVRKKEVLMPRKDNKKVESVSHLYVHKEM